MTNLTRYALALLAVIALTPGVAAQGRPNQPPRGRAAEAGALPPGEVLNMLDAYAVLQAQKALELTDEQEGEFIPRLKRLQQTRRRNQQARNGLIQELRRMTAPNVPQIDEGAVRDRLQQLREHDRRAAAELEKAYEALDGMLTVRQQARFRVFEENIERRKLDLLMRARRTPPRDDRQ